MPRKSKDQKDRTSIVISVVIHVLLIGGVAYWAYKTGKLQEALETILKIAQGDKKEQVKEDKPPPRPTARPKTGALPQTGPPPGGGGTRRAVASDAPAAAGETFFEDTRTQVGDGSAGGAGPKEEKKAAPIIVLRPPPKVDLRPPVATGKGSTAKLIQERQSAKTVSDSIGSEAIERSTSSDVGDVVSKVTGTTLVDGKFAVVRGLSDRYTATTLNGGEIPTPDPYRRQVQLDIFPAKIVQSVNVIKTFTPDLPGGFAGGLIDIRTKSFPEKFTFSVSAGVGYNTQANLNPDFITDQESGWDAWAFGSKARALPGILENASPPPPPGRPPLNESPASADARRNQANMLAAMTDSFSSSVMGPVKTESGMNQAYNLVVGDTVRLLERPFGYFFGVDYKNGYSFYDNGEYGRYGPRLEPRKLLTETRGIHAVDWTAAVNLSYQLNPEHELNFNFLYNQSGENIARNAVGQDFTTGSLEDTLNQNALDYIERNLTTYQLRGSHLLPTLNEFKVEWLAGLSSTYQDEPDERFFNYWSFTAPDGSTGNSFNNALPQPVRPTRFFRTIDEESSNLKLDMTAPFRQWADLESSFKFGAFYNGIQRSFDEKTYTYQTQTGDAGWINGGVPNNYLAPRYLGYTTEVIPRRGTNFTFARYINSELGNSTYEGEQIVPAGYGMVDLALTDSVRFIGGARAEGTDLTIDTVTSQYPQGTNTVINQLDILPAIGFLWNIKSNMNLRINYGKTIGRPAFREIAPVRVYDIVNDVIYEGNPNLQITEIQNYDIRWEWFPRLGEVISAGFFFKKLKNAIEAYAVTLDDGIITFVNRDEAILLGIELEGRTSLDILDANLANFSVGGNLSFIYSKVELTPTELFNKRIYDPDAEASRPLYDQSPYIINLDLTYSNPSSGTTATLSANLAGERIFFAKAAGPDVYEHPPASLDFVISQQLSRHMKIKFTARNLLNSPVLRTYGTSDQYIYTRYTRGLTFGLSLSYDF